VLTGRLLGNRGVGRMTVGCSVGYAVTSGYGCADIQWDSDELLLGGR
jgi:hypothetical protein